MRDIPRSGKDKVVGILYPGEMGSALGKLMVDAGLKVLTTLEDRGPRTSRQCHQAGLEVASSFDQVIASSDIVISLVPPLSALQVAEHYCEAAGRAPEDQIFIDANSISAETASRICSVVTAQKKCFVDASIHGLASRLSSRGVLFLSGARAQEIAELFNQVVSVRLLGDIPGVASSHKVILGGFSKGIVALFLELGITANELGLLDDVLVELREFYPGPMEVIERLLPTYPLHAKRRGHEMEELERTMRSMGLQPRVVREIRRTTEEFGELGLSQGDARRDLDGWTVRDVIEALNDHLFFRAEQKIKSP